MVFPQLEELAKRRRSTGEKINQYTRFITVPLAVVQSIGMFALLKNQGIIGSIDAMSLVAVVVTMTAGTLFAMWLGELTRIRHRQRHIASHICRYRGRLPVILANSIDTTLNI